MMKKIFACMLIMTMIFALTACGKSSDTVDNSNDKMEASVNDNVGTNTANDNDSTNTAGEKDSGDQPTASQNDNKILVAYFSATGTTAGVAEKLADGLKADLYEIEPKEPYTDADLDYSDNDSRSTVEMNDSKARPEIANSVDNMAQYDVVFVGYPIWWGDAPRIVSTFMESYDFSGKTIIPFCTSGGSGIGSSASNLEKLTKKADWLEGKRFAGDASEKTIMEWANSLNLSK